MILLFLRRLIVHFDLISLILKDDIKFSFLLLCLLLLTSASRKCVDISHLFCQGFYFPFLLLPLVFFLLLLLGFARFIFIHGIFNHLVERFVTLRFGCFFILMTMNLLTILFTEHLEHPLPDGAFHLNFFLLVLEGCGLPVHLVQEQLALRIELHLDWFDLHFVLFIDV